MGDYAANIAIGIAVGVIGELFAYALSVWRYRHWTYPVANVLGMFGAVMGGLALLVPEVGLSAVVAGAFAAGLAYEWLNFLVLGWWWFPQDRVWRFSGRASCAAVIAVAWALVPILIHMSRQLGPVGG